MIHKLYRPYLIYKISTLQGDVIYIGRTQRAPLVIRLKGHLYGKMKDKKGNLKISLIEKVKGRKESLERETYWINHFFSLGCNLLNIKQVKKHT